jgi:hypothetical protein
MDDQIQPARDQVQSTPPTSLSILPAKNPSDLLPNPSPTKLPTRRRLKWLILILIPIVLACAYVAMPAVVWDGSTDLQVEFLIVDGFTGRPIDDAQIHVHAEPGGSCGEKQELTFDLRTNADGVAGRLCESCTSSGTYSLMVETFGVRPPPWWFQASAEGYLPSTLDYLERRPYSKQAKRTDRGAILTVRIELFKAGDPVQRPKK